MTEEVEIRLGREILRWVDLCRSQQLEYLGSYHHSSSSLNDNAACSTINI